MTAIQKEALKEILEEYGYTKRIEEYTCQLTDDDTSQYNIALGDDKWIFSEAEQSPLPDEQDNVYYRTEYADFKDYNEVELNEMVTSHYDSLEALKELDPKSWKMIALECGFENNML